MKELEGLNMAGHAGDVLGDAYEYLIGQFASESGKKPVNSIPHNRSQNWWHKLFYKEKKIKRLFCLRRDHGFGLVTFER